MNPFGIEKSPSGLSGPSGHGGVLDLDVNSPEGNSAKSGYASGVEGGIGFETRRSDLKSEVRWYADKLYAEIQAIYAAHGAKDAAELLVKAETGEVVTREEMGKLSRLQTDLHTALARNETPPGERGLPPVEAFHEIVGRVNVQVAPRKVTDFGHWNEFELIDGELNGRVMVDRTYYPLIGGQLIESIDDTKIEGCEEVRNVDGKLNGRIRIGRSWYPVINGELIERLGWRRIEDVQNVRNIDGKLNASVRLEDSSHWKAVIDGEVLENLPFQGIADCMWAHNVDGRVNGTGIIDNVWTPIINGRPIKELDGKEIKNCGFVENIDGKLNGRVSFDGKHYLPVIAGKVIESIAGRRILDCPFADNIHGKLNGRVVIEDRGRTLPVIDGELIQEIEGQKILICDDAHDMDGKFYGRVSFNGATYHPVIGGRLMDTMGGQKIERMIGFGGDAGGVFSGTLRVTDADGKGVKRKVFLGEIVD